MTTFSDLGLPFVLFEAPVDDAADFVLHGACSLCGAAARPCFALGVGSRIVVPCAKCASDAGVSPTREDATCASCGSAVPPATFPAPLLACYACLRAGRAALTKDTELGAVAWEHAAAGVTHGVPGLHHPDFPMVPSDDDPDWIAARVDSRILFELVRTPNYRTIQGPQWLFCCGTAMKYLGSWSRTQFAECAPDGDGRALLATFLGEDVPGLWEDSLHDETGIYVFSCAICDAKRAHWDIA